MERNRPAFECMNECIKFFKLPTPLDIQPLAGGANNRVYKLEFANQKPIILKQYFQHPEDLRPRLLAEFSFLQYAWEQGIRNIPEPLIASQEHNTAIYTFLEGRLIQNTDISDSAIDQLISFFLKLNQQKSKGTHLPLASEACFTLDEYIKVTEKRIERLKKHPFQTPLGNELSSFLNSHLLPRWDLLKSKTLKSAYPITACPVGIEDRCITPSDFGFHNAMIDKSIYFIDFEYAGWDDPCKTVCDLFCQPKIPIPFRYFRKIAEALASVSLYPENCLKRIDLILPVIQMKWCCILLNSFTQVGQNRRAFSHSDETKRQEEQLKKAKELLYQINLEQSFGLH